MDDGDRSLHPSARRVVAWAAERGLDIEVREYPEDGARTAAEAAAAVGCRVDQIVKSMIFAARSAPGGPTGEGDGEGDELILALTSGARQVDGEALAGVAGVDRCGRADPEAVRSATGYAIGGVPPFGHATALRTWIDPHLLDFERVWAAAGTPRHVFPIAPRALVELTGAEIASFTRSTTRA